MKTVKIKTYTFEELSEEAKQKAIDDARNGDYYLSREWWDCVYDYWKEELAKLGFYEIDISFSGFWSQGDGASFTGKMYLEDYLRARKIYNKYRGLLKFSYEQPCKIIRVTNHYVHERTTTPDIYMETSEMDDKQLAKLQELENYISNDIEELNHQIYKELEEEYNGLMEDDAIAEHLTINEYQFTSEGKDIIYL